MDLLPSPSPNHLPLPFSSENSRFNDTTPSLTFRHYRTRNLRSKGITIREPEIFASLLDTCYSLRAIYHGVRVHHLILVYLLRNNLVISSKLVRLHASCGYADVAHKVFDRMSKRKSSAFAWNSLISDYVESCQYEDAMSLYFQMALNQTVIWLRKVSDTMALCVKMALFVVLLCGV